MKSCRSERSLSVDLLSSSKRPTRAVSRQRALKLEVVSRNEHRDWQRSLAEKLEHRKEYLSEKWKRTNLAHGIEVGQDALKEGWRSTELGRTVDKEREVLLEKWRNSDKKELKKWQSNVKAGLAWTNIFGPAIGGIVFALFGFVWTVLVWGTVILLSVPYVILRGRLIDSTTLAAAIQIAFVQFITIFCYAAYKGYEWTMTRELTEEEKKKWLEDQELQQMQLDELSDFDLRLIGDRQRKISERK